MPGIFVGGGTKLLNLSLALGVMVYAFEGSKEYGDGLQLTVLLFHRGRVFLCGSHAFGPAPGHAPGHSVPGRKGNSTWNVDVLVPVLSAIVFHLVFFFFF